MGAIESLQELFTDNPTNWIKWGIVFVILILGYVLAVPLYKKIEYRMSWKYRRDVARQRNHVIKATLVKKHPSGEVGHYNWRAVYRYEINGEEKQYSAQFKNPARPPLILYLYYVNTPKKIFSYDEYHYENHKAIILLPLLFLPWILAIVAVFLLQIEIPVS